MQIFNYIWGYDLEIYVSLLSPDFPEETCQRLNISSAPNHPSTAKSEKGPQSEKRLVLYLFYSDLAIREAIKNMLSISDKWSKLQTDPAAATILLF